MTSDLGEGSGEGEVNRVRVIGFRIRAKGRVIGFEGVRRVRVSGYP